MRTLLLLAVAASVFGADIPPGVHVLLRFQNSVTSRSASVGDFVYLQTATPVSVDGKILVPTGSYVQGIVSHVKRPGRVKGKAELAIRLETVTLPSGQQFKFQARVASVDGDSSGQKVADKESTIQQAGTVGKDVANVAIMAGSGAATGGLIGAISDHPVRGLGIGAGAGTAVGLATALLTRGNEVELKQGSSLDVVFDRAVGLE